MDPADTILFTDFVSVVIPTRDRAGLLADALRSLLAQDYPPDRFEIVVVDDGSKDGTREVVLAAAEEGDGIVRLVSQPASGVNAARNTGIRNATGGLLCFVDDDVEAPSGWIRALVSGAVRYPDVDVFAGRIRFRLEGRMPWSCGRESLEDAELDLGDEDIPTDRAWGCNLAMRPRAVSLAGPFDETLRIYGDEVEWEFRYMRAGGRIIYVADALVWHRRTEKDLRISSMMRRRFLRGRGDVWWRGAAGLSLPSVGSDIEGTIRGLGHRLVRGCNWGLLAAAENSGRLWERASYSRRGAAR